MTDIFLLGCVTVLAAAGAVSIYKRIPYRDALIRVVKYPLTFFKTTPKP